MLKCMMACVCLVMLTGCLSLQIKANERPLRLDMEGLASGYVSYSGIRPWDGTIVDFGLLSNAKQDNELISLEVWPLVEVGAGLVGMRLKVLPIDMGLGVLFYQPQPHDYIDHGDHEARSEDDEE